MGVGRAASVVKAGSQEGVNRGSGAMRDLTMFGDDPLDGVVNGVESRVEYEVENDCCMATGWAGGMTDVHSYACRGPCVTNHDPETLCALPECVTE